jgi:hypothetical protein
MLEAEPFNLKGNECLPKNGASQPVHNKKRYIKWKNTSAMEGVVIPFSFVLLRKI